MPDPKNKRTAGTVVTDDQPSFVDEHPKHGKQIDDGRKVTDQDHVGAKTPDADPER